MKFKLFLFDTSSKFRKGFHQFSELFFCEADGSYFCSHDKFTNDCEYIGYCQYAHRFVFLVYSIQEKIGAQKRHES